MNLYFLDNENKQHLVATDVLEESIGRILELDLVTRKPNFKFRNTRRWWDDFLRMWIDFGSHTEFYLYQDEKKALNVVVDEDVSSAECEACRIDSSGCGE